MNAQIAMLLHNNYIIVKSLQGRERNIFLRCIVTINKRRWETSNLKTNNNQPNGAPMPFQGLTMLLPYQ